MVILGSFKGRQKAPRAINLGWDLSTLDFWPKIISSHLVMHIKATKPLWFVKKTQLESVSIALGALWRPQNDPKMRKNSDFSWFLKQTIGLWWL